MVVEGLENRRLLSAVVMSYNSVSDGGFEAPALSLHAYQVDPASTPWTFAGTSGVSANDSGFTTGNPGAPSGAQVGFIKDGASISQSVYLDAGVYNLSMYAAQRANYQTQSQTVDFLLNNQVIGWTTPASNTNGGVGAVAHAYVVFQSTNFIIQTSGQYTITLQGMSPSQRR